jgi:hypothetical protein
LAGGSDLIVLSEDNLQPQRRGKERRALIIILTTLAAAATGWLPPTVRSLPDGGFEAVFGLRHLIKTFTDNRDYLLLMAVLC